MDATPGFQSAARMLPITGQKWQLEEPLVYQSILSDHPRALVVPVGFRTSFRSVPRGLRWLVVPKEEGPRRATAPAVLFAWLVKQSGEGLDASRELFRESLVAAGVPLWQRVLLRVVG